MDDDTLFVGLEVPSGEEVKVPIFHTLTTGQTQLSGKTTVQKKFAELLAELGFKVLLFDVKENLEDYSGIGKEIPVCLRESTDPLVLLPLLESIFQRRLPTGYYSVICEVTSGTEDYCEVIKRARDLEESSRSGWKKGACRTLYDLLERLQEQLQKVDTVSSLELPYDINRMVLNYFPRASQQLFIRNAFEDILKIHNERTIPMLDEAYKFLPQRWSSACAQSIQDVITQTAITKSYCYLATQFLAPTNKDPLKACAVRLLGTQDHKTEAKHTLDLIPFKGIATEDDIMKLPLGHFYVTTKKWARLTYFLPKGVPLEIGRAVATGKKTVEFVRDTYLVPKKPEEGEIDMEKLEKLEKNVSEIVTSMGDLTSLVRDHIGDPIKHGEDLKDQLDEIAKGMEQLDKKFETLKTVDSLRALSQEELTALTELAKRSKTTLNLKHTELQVNLSHSEKTVNMTTETQTGQILYCAVEEFENEVFTVNEMDEVLKEHGWNIKKSSLAPTISSTLVGQGLLIKIAKGKYRAPKHLKIQIEKTIDA